MRHENKFSQCLVCSDSLDSKTIVYCPHCNKPYHEHCWRKAGYGCKIYKCKGSTLFRWAKIEILFSKIIGQSERLSNKCTNQSCTNYLKESSPFYRYCTKCGEELNSLEIQKKIPAYTFFEFIARYSVVFLVSLVTLFFVYISANYNIIKQNKIYASQTAFAFQLTEFKTQTSTSTSVPTNTLVPTRTLKPTVTPKPTSTLKPTATRQAFAPYRAIKDCAKARVIIGDIVVVEDGISNLFIRSTSDNHPSSNIIDRLYPGQKAKIIAGPECSWGWIMWKIQRLNDGLEGWVAESDGDEFWLQLAQ